MRGEQEINCLTKVKQNLGRNSVHYFCSDLQKIIRILKSARPNPAQSNFPDFLFENGLLSTFKSPRREKQGKVRNIDRDKHSFVKRRNSDSKEWAAS